MQQMNQIINKITARNKLCLGYGIHPKHVHDMTFRMQEKKKRNILLRGTCIPFSTFLFYTATSFSHRCGFFFCSAYAGEV